MSAEVGTVVSGCRSVIGSVPQLLWMSTLVPVQSAVSKLFTLYIMAGTSCQRKYLFPFKGQQRDIVKLRGFSNKFSQILHEHFLNVFSRVLFIFT